MSRPKPVIKFGSIEQDNESRGQIRKIILFVTELKNSKIGIRVSGFGLTTNPVYSGTFEDKSSNRAIIEIPANSNMEEFIKFVGVHNGVVLETKEINDRTRVLIDTTKMI